MLIQLLADHWTIYTCNSLLSIYNFIVVFSFIPKNWALFIFFQVVAGVTGKKQGWNEYDIWHFSSIFSGIGIKKFKICNFIQTEYARNVCINLVLQPIWTIQHYMYFVSIVRYDSSQDSVYIGTIWESFVCPLFPGVLWFC